MAEEQKHAISDPTEETITVTTGPDISMSEDVMGMEIVDIKPILPQIPFSFPGQTFDTKCQKLILNVWDFFKRVKKNPDLLDEIRTPQERAAAALHVSAATIGKIGKNLKKTGKLETPGKKRKRTRPIVDSVDAFDEDVIRTIIQEMKSNKVTPTLPMVLAEARQKINFTGGATSFRRILQRMGYKNLSQKSQSSKVKTIPTLVGTVLKTQKIKQEPTYSNSGLGQIQVVNAGGMVTAQTVNGETIQVNQSTASAIASAAQASNHQPQTVHVIQPDNTVHQIQIVYAQL